MPTRETVVYVDLPGAERLPPVIDYGSVPAKGEGGIARVGQAAYSLAAPGRGLKAGLHHSGPATDPDDEPRAGRPGGCLGGAVGRDAGIPMRARRSPARRASTRTRPTSAFVLERQGRVVVGSACSGHGFKFAPIVGRTLAALARAAAD